MLAVAHVLRARVLQAAPLQHAHAADDGARAVLAAAAVNEDRVAPSVHHDSQGSIDPASVHLFAVRLVALDSQVVVLDALIRSKGFILSRQAIQEINNAAQAQAA